jgi:uncharacterized membrane protein
MITKKSNLYITLKTIFFRTTSVILTYIILFLTTGNASTSIKITSFMFIAHTIKYWLFEKFFAHYEEKYIYNKEKSINESN